MGKPTYEEGRLAAIAVRLALSSGLPATSARAALELASHMIGDQLDSTAQTSEPRGSSEAFAPRAGGTKRDISNSKRL